MNRQQYKEASCYLAIRQGFCLVRRNTEVHAVSAAGNMKCISRSTNIEDVWKDTYNILRKGKERVYGSRVDPFELPQEITEGWKHRKVDPDTGFIVNE